MSPLVPPLPLRRPAAMLRSSGRPHVRQELPMSTTRRNPRIRDVNPPRDPIRQDHRPCREPRIHGPTSSRSSLDGGVPAVRKNRGRARARESLSPVTSCTIGGPSAGALGALPRGRAQLLLCRRTQRLHVLSSNPGRPRRDEPRLAATLPPVPRYAERPAAVESWTGTTPARCIKTHVLIGEGASPP